VEEDKRGGGGEDGDAGGRKVGSPNALLILLHLKVSKVTVPRQVGAKELQILHIYVVLRLFWKVRQIEPRFFSFL
jgi:hypothetical protein